MKRLALLLLTAAAPLPRIDLKPSGEDWEVRYTIAQPAKSLQFEIPYGDYRQTTWRAADPAVRVVAEGEAVRAERRDGRPFTTLSFRLTPHYREVPKNYAPFSPYSDGGMLVFTGEFHACPDAPCKEGGRWPVHITAPGQRLLAAGQSRTGALSFTSSGEATLVYAGQATPVETPQVLAVIDPALPAPIRQQIDALLPKATDWFGQSFGALKERPMLFASLDRWPRPDSGLSYQGGTLPGQVFLHFYGSDWRRDAARADFIPWFFAHELAHFYHRARSGDLAASDDEAWIHEGGAEAFAALAVRDFGDPGVVDRKVDKAFGRCAADLAKLGDKPLDASAKVGAFDNYYDCGLILQLSIDAALRRESGGRETLVTLWRDFLDRTRAGEPWNAKTFLDTARHHGLPAPMAELVSDLTTKPQKLTGSELRSLLKL